jgi:hypothetical protein
MNEGEKLFCEWQRGMTGKFYSFLIEAMLRADGENIHKLEVVYPELTNAVVSYQTVTGYWDDLKTRYEKQFNKGGKLSW